jgi:hypothetical protein
LIIVFFSLLPFNKFRPFVFDFQPTLRPIGKGIPADPEQSIAQLKEREENIKPFVLSLSKHF